MESLVDERGRILIPKNLRELLGIKEGSSVEIVEDIKEGSLTIKTSTKAKSSRRKPGVKELYGIGVKVNKTGKPEPWPSPREIKSIWE
jgi:AbrB family looped-hinge helix DNA binding protein